MTVATAIGTTTGYLHQFVGSSNPALDYSDGAARRDEPEQAERSGFGPATTVGLSPAAQALLARDAAQQGTPPAPPPGLRVERMPIYPLNAGLTPLERAQIGEIIDRYEADMSPGADLRLEAELRSAGLLPQQIEAGRAGGSAPALPPEPPASRAPDDAPVSDLGEAVREVTGND